MIPDFLSLSDHEKALILKYAPVLEKRACDFVPKFLSKAFSSDELLDLYNTYYTNIMEEIEKIEIDPSEKASLKCATRKTVERSMLIHLKLFQDSQNKRLEERERFYKAITDISRIRIEYDNLSNITDIMSRIVASIAEDMKLPLVWIGKVESTRVNIVASAGRASGYLDGIKISVDPSVPEGKGPAGIAFRTGRPYVLNDLSSLIFGPWKERADRFDLAGVANTFFTTSDERWITAMYCGKGEKFPAQIEDLLEDLGMELKVLIESYKRSVELSNIRNYERGLLEIQRYLIKSPSPEMIYKKIVETIGKHTQKTVTVKVMIKDPNSEWMKIMASLGDDSEFFLSNSKAVSVNVDRYPEGHLATSKSFREGLPVIMNTDQPVYKDYWDKFPELVKLKVVGSWPIFERGSHPIAVLTIGSYDPDYFTKDLVRLVEQIVSSTGMAIEGYKKDQKLEYLSFHDPLTGLTNRRYFEQSAQDAMRRARREKRHLAIGIADLDNFKMLNDTFGHIVGDEILKKTGESFQSILRGGDLVSRMGGDEFLFHVMIDSIEDLKVISKRMIETLSGIEAPYKITFSLGWSVYPVEGENLEVLMNIADRVMYTVKNKGGNGYGISIEI
ncbi:sensor domain-containing diguanylate cyclase [Athalassotoga saccharophila]|uniref:sensor domain-containing diguanylate cyclase n=1 Tax=Athalassotoga saccharophila TaxID=1441386 RepID=UPI00137A00DC|nr:sensor domain-containing diguanylate cyclase [Athalassotoga saccharophila]BBJ28720.1 putative signaling protein [Athalassotoga saccharophila]